MGSVNESAIDIESMKAVCSEYCENVIAIEIGNCINKNSANRFRLKRSLAALKHTIDNIPIARNLCISHRPLPWLFETWSSLSFLYSSFIDVKKLYTESFGNPFYTRISLQP